MGNFGFWLGVGAAQKTARLSANNRREHHVISVIVGIVLAVMVAGGLFILLALN
jgi:hypothetical protein